MMHSFISELFRALQNHQVVDLSNRNPMIAFENFYVLLLGYQRLVRSFDKNHISFEKIGSLIQSFIKSQPMHLQTVYQETFVDLLEEAINYFLNQTSENNHYLDEILDVTEVMALLMGTQCDDAWWFDTLVNLQKAVKSSGNSAMMGELLDYQLELEAEKFKRRCPVLSKRLVRCRGENAVKARLLSNQGVFEEALRRVVKVSRWRQTSEEDQKQHARCVNYT